MLSSILLVFFHQIMRCIFFVCGKVFLKNPIKNKKFPYFTGYGHQTPLSPEGKSFCIIYGLIGIPMTMLLVTAVVERLMVPVNLLLIWLNNTMGHLYSPFSLRLFHLGLVSIKTVVYWG